VGTKGAPNDGQDTAKRLRMIICGKCACIRANTQNLTSEAGTRFDKEQGPAGQGCWHEDEPVQQEVTIILIASPFGAVVRRQENRFCHQYLYRG